MTNRARAERRRRQARRRQVRRRRSVALLVLGAVALLLVAMVATQAPADSTSPPPTTAAEGAPTEVPPPAPEPCADGEVEIRIEFEGKVQVECEPQPEPASPKKGSEPAPEKVESAETVHPSPAPAPAPTPTPEPEANGGKSSGVVAGSAIEEPQGGSDSGSQGGSSHQKHHTKGGGSGHSGGTTAVVPTPQPQDWSWSGSWAIPWQIVACESGGNYGALNASSGAGGAYQILPSTWAAYGGAGQPQTAPPAEQNRIASEIWADSGPAAWVCAQDGNWMGASLGSFSGLAGSLGTLPDPLPPARRLDPRFAALLTRTARASHVDWALLLAIVRMRGGRGPDPATGAELRRIAANAAAAGGALRARARRLFTRTAEAQKLVALTYYDRAVGRRGLVEGLEAIKGKLEKRVLNSPRLDIYSGGREDVAAGRVDVRVLTLLLYLSQRYHSVTVSCLVTGHSFLTAEGRPSLHPFGRAVDIAALNGTPILGHQQPGGLTERALRLILLLPKEMQPSELISLFELGGPSFALADHADHIHVGF